MNAEQAKTIPITLILDKINFQPQRSINKEAVYFSPLDLKKKPTLWVNTEKNIWHDFGLKKGGDNIEFIRCYLRTQGVSNNVSDALRYMKYIVGYTPIIQAVEDSSYIQEDKTLAVKNVRPIEKIALLHYTVKRGITEKTTRNHLNEARVHNKRSAKNFFALCMKNEENGYQLWNPLFQGLVGKPGITFIRGLENNYEGIHIFKDAFDFLSVMTQRDDKPFKDDTIILHSYRNLQQGAAYIKGFGYRTGYTWMDNDGQGRKAIKSWTDFFANEENLVHHPMNDTYASHVTVNAAHMKKRGLKMEVV